MSILNNVFSKLSISRSNILLHAFVTLLTLLVTTSSFAQSAQIIGGSSFARECYRVSSAASLTGFSGREDLETCDKAISHGKLDKGDLVATYVNRGIIHAAREDYVAAVRDYERAIKLSDDVPEAYINRGNLWFVAQHYKEAIEDYAKALGMGVSQPHVALLNRGMANESLGNLELAKEDYLSALAMVEEWPTAQKKLDRVNRKIEEKAINNGH